MGYQINHIQERRLSGRCCYGACPIDAMPGSDYCTPHDERERARARAKAKRRRDRLASKGRCIVAGCGKRVAVRDGAPLRRCPECSKQHAAREKIKRGSPRKPSGVPGNVPIPPSRWKTETYADGSARERFTGRGKRGGQSQHERDRDTMRDVREALLLGEAFLSAFPDVRETIDPMPAIQRAEALELVASRLTRASRMLSSAAAGVSPTWRRLCACCGQERQVE